MKKPLIAVILLICLGLFAVGVYRAVGPDPVPADKPVYKPNFVKKPAFNPSQSGDDSDEGFEEEDD